MNIFPGTDPGISAYAWRNNARRDIRQLHFFITWMLQCKALSMQRLISLVSRTGELADRKAWEPWCEEHDEKNLLCASCECKYVLFASSRFWSPWWSTPAKRSSSDQCFISHLCLTETLAIHKRVAKPRLVKFTIRFSQRIPPEMKVHLMGQIPKTAQFSGFWPEHIQQASKPHPSVKDCSFRLNLFQRGQDIYPSFVKVESNAMLT